MQSGPGAQAKHSSILAPLGRDASLDSFSAFFTATAIVPSMDTTWGRNLCFKSEVLVPTFNSCFS
ncbi:hypothetical protein E2C01_079284 [Portunus trituberculatus]|uniref:Uncharacterized protein n=1 Tax=Portunus trituberculatus TaxID=210409 RepID=A0A5B7IWH7_PORTR|nr:hypothetical protein [Portunus trituberculatus]